MTRITLNCLAGLAFLLVTFEVRGGADNLFKGKDVVKIGKGEQKGKKIAWKTCSGQEDGEYVNPPYSLDKADNCSVGPPTFGVECEGERCRVVDAERIRKYFPGAHDGDTVQLHIEEHRVTVTHGRKTLVIER